MYPDIVDIWILNIDSSTGEKHKGAGFIIEDPDGHQYACAMKFLFRVSNNETEYEAPWPDCAWLGISRSPISMYEVISR